MNNTNTKNLRFEEEYIMGTPYKLWVFQGEKRLCHFYWNMKGYLPYFAFLRKEEGREIHIRFGEWPKTKAIKAFKDCFKEGLEIQSYDKKI